MNPNNGDNSEEILKYLAQGLTAKDIAPLLFLSHRTIETKFDNLKKKYNAKNLPHLVAITHNQSQASKLQGIKINEIINQLNDQLSFWNKAKIEN